MPDNTAPDFASAQSLEQLYEMLDGVQMKNGWTWQAGWKLAQRGLRQCGARRQIGR